MQDVRIRTGIAAVLSCVAFFSIEGALAGLIWWLLFANPLEILKRIRVVFPAVLMIIFFSGVVELTGGGGVSYGIRMLVILALGVWLYHEYRKGEFLHLSTWLFGTGIGFDLGMLAEMGMQTLDTLASDFLWIQMAQKLKGTPFGLKNFITTGIILITRTLQRAEDATELLAIRGFSGGGTLCPEFIGSTGDKIGVLAALCLVFISFLPASEFFILYR